MISNVDRNGVYSALCGHSGTQDDGGSMTWVISIHYGRGEENIENYVLAPEFFGALEVTQLLLLIAHWPELVM